MRHATPIIALTLLLCASQIEAVPVAGQAVAERADAYVQSLSNADIFLREVRDTVDMARAGEYGKIASADLSRLDDARARIAALLDGHEHARQLSPAERIELFNAQEEIVSIVRNDDKGRRVCTRVKGTGTRIARAECLTVAQREQRAKATRESSRFQQGYLDPNCATRERLGQVAAGGC